MLRTGIVKVMLLVKAKVCMVEWGGWASGFWEMHVGWISYCEEINV